MSAYWPIQMVRMIQIWKNFISILAGICSFQAPATPKVPANLQGIWNPHLRPPWSSNYTININTEENYWPAETCNLSELHEPLLGFIGNLSKTGSISAKTFYGVNDGWSAGHNTDIWAMSNPVGDFGNGDPMWACWNMGGAWLATHLWERYAFTQDKIYLQNTAYPLMKGAANFCLGWLVPDSLGRLITSPSTSPENEFVTKTGYIGSTLYGATADLAIIRELFKDLLLAQKVLANDPEYTEKIQNAYNRLLPYQISKTTGGLQEWYHDWADADPKHRHQSHLFGLFPGRSIDYYQNTDFAMACQKTLEIKGDETTGWSKGWRINLWARLHDGNRAYKMYRELLRYVDPDRLPKAKRRGGGTYPNLMDAHPPFQIDGNFGGTAAVAEMLLQSNENSIELLPAIPQAWAPKGNAKGICARGGFVLDFAWQNGKITTIKIHSKATNSTTLMYNGKKTELNMKKGASKVLF